MSDEKLMIRNSLISTSVETTTTSTGADDEKTSSASQIDEKYNLKIRELLQLGNSIDDQQIAKGLMINGRQALRDYEDELLHLDSKILEQNMSKNSNELLSILKKYNEQQWKADINEKWFHIFLEKMKSQCYTEYDSVLTRIAEHGGFKLMKIDVLLSLTIQFFVKFEADSKENLSLFDQIFDSMLSEGYESIKTYENCFLSNPLNIQIENEQNALYLALKCYFHSSLINLFNKAQIDTNNTEVLETILNCVMKAGWWKGIHDERVREIISIDMNVLIEKLKEYFKKNNIPITKEPSSSDNREIGQVQEPEPIEEHQVVLMCISQDEKLKLSDLVAAGELTYINQTFTQVIDTIIKDYVSNQRFLLFIKSCFTPIMYLLKRCQNLDDFFKGLDRKYSKCKLTVRKPKLSLRMLIHIILTNSELSLSRKIMSLLSIRNPVPFLQPSLSNHQNNYVFVSNITHVWDYSRATLLSFGIGTCKGKSTILNRIFLSSFERSMNSIYFQNTIDIDFGYSFLKPRLVNIADIHGSIDKTLLERIHQLFNGFLIHIQYEYLQNNRDSCLNILNVVKNNKKYCLLIIRDCPIEDHEDCERDLLSEIIGYEKYILPNVSDQNDRDNEELISTLNDKIWDTMAAKCPQISSSTKNDLENLMDETYKQEIHEIVKAILPLEQVLIGTADGNISVNDCFPEYLIFANLCELKLKLANYNFYGNGTDEDIDKVRREILQKEYELQSTKTYPSRIYKLFCDVINAPNMLICLDSLITQLKQARIKYVLPADMASSIPLEKKLSIDVLWRNTIICSQYETEEVQQHLRKQYSEYVKAGFPFEIIDGDNFHFQYSFLYETLQPFRNYRTLVISVIGPQNSGKSTLLNYMFGTLFDVRDGRCTRGIYGSLFKTNRTDFEYIMLIDTEGLLGAEGQNMEYDRRIVLFCLAVSHLVIVNVAGEINNPIKQILTLCAESLSKMGVTHIPQPTVHFVLNQRADPDIEKNKIAIDIITTEVRNLGLHESIIINENTFHALPVAFQSEGKTLTTNKNLSGITKTVSEFIECVHSLCGKILDSVADCLTQTNEFFYPLQWLSSSQTIFDTIQKFPDLTYYQDIHERDLDKILREHIQHDLTNIFSDKYRHHFITECSKQTEQELRDLFEKEQQKIDEQTRNNLEERFKFLKVPSTLRRRTEQFLRVQVKQMFKGLRVATIAINERVKVEALVSKGKGELQELIEKTIQNERKKSTNERMQSDDVRNEFDKMFDQKIQTIRSAFVPEECLKQAYINIYANYNIYEKECLLKFQDIYSEHLIFLSNSNQFISLFLREGYKADLVKVHHYNPNTNYSSNMIRSLVYLNKDLLEKIFNECYESSDMIDNPDVFQMKIRNDIQNQKPIEQDKSKLDESQMYFPISTVFKEVIEQITKTMQSLENNEVRQIQMTLIQKIVGLINSLIINVNTELSPFCLSLSRPLKSIFHSCAIILLTKYYYNEQKKYFDETLAKLETKKNDLKQYFTNMVDQGTELDKEYTIKLCKDLKEIFIQLIFNDGQDIIDKILNNSTYLNRKWIQNSCDDKLLINQTIQFILKYIQNPTESFEQLFNEKWNEIEIKINRELISKKSYYVGILIEFFTCMNNLLKEIEQLPSSVKLADEIFTIKNTNSLSINEQLNDKKCCLTMLLDRYLTKRSIPDSIEQNNQNYIVNTEAVRLFQSLFKPQIPSDVLSNILVKSSPFKQISIGNLEIFLQTLNEQRDSFIMELQKIDVCFKSVAKRNTYEDLLDKVLGCSNLCPCCNRPCDVDHTQMQSKPGSMGNEHRCLSGHALRAMNGYKFEVTQEASLLTCDQIKNDYIVVVNQRRYQWSRFKMDHPDWLFDLPLNKMELNVVHKKFRTIWDKIGPQLCEAYGMKFVQHISERTCEQKIHEAYHFILLLDASASMGVVSRWDYLMDAAKEFLDRRRELKTDDRFTIIVFSDQTEVKIKGQTVDEVDLEMISYLDGRTSFSAAFTRVAEIINEFKNKPSPNSIHQNFAIVFMTDGEDENDSTRELDHLINNHKSVIKRFWTLALSDLCSSMETLEKINEKMGGSFYDIQNPAGLLNVYAEVATSTFIPNNNNQ